MKRTSLSKINVQVNQDSLIIDGNTITIQNINFIKEMLPRGANGLVFQATDTQLQRPVAVKIWIPRQGDSRDRTQQALAEARKIARLNHKNIAQIYQCSQLWNGWIYSVMEYVNGMNLDAFIKANYPDFFQRFRLWKQIEEALNYSHKLGVFHGDLHPGNVLIIDETIKVIDFGTSIFAAKKTDSQMRETRLLINLNKKMFPSYKPSLNEIIDVDLRGLNPVLALPALSGWVDILFDWEEMFCVARSEDWLITKMHHFTFNVLKAPIFSIPRLTKQLSRQKLSRNVIKYFLAYCLLWVDVFLKKHERRKPYNLLVYDHDIGLDPQVNEALLEDAIPSLREAFYKNGPFD